jgi:hypothetical protein
MNKHFNADGSMAGFQYWAKLPSSIHGLYTLDPLRANEMMGPAVKIGMILMNGVDPFTGGKIIGADNEFVGASERVMKAFDEAVVNPFVPNRAIDAGRALLQSKWPEVEQKFIDFGMSPEMREAILGPKGNDAYEKRMKRALSLVKSAYMGHATQTDLDVYFKVIAMMKETKTDLSKLTSVTAKRGTEKQLDQNIERTIKTYDRLLNKLENLLDVKSEYDSAVEAVGAPAPENIEYKDIGVDLPSDGTDDGAEPTEQEIQKDYEEGAKVLNADPRNWVDTEYPTDRIPAGAREEAPRVGMVEGTGVAKGIPAPAYSQIWDDWLASEQEKFKEKNGRYPTKEESGMMILEEMNRSKKQNYKSPSEPQRDIASEKDKK